MVTMTCDEQRTQQEMEDEHVLDEDGMQSRAHIVTI